MHHLCVRCSSSVLLLLARCAIVLCSAVQCLQAEGGAVQLGVGVAFSSGMRVEVWQTKQGAWLARRLIVRALFLRVRALCRLPKLLRCSKQEVSEFVRDWETNAERQRSMDATADGPKKASAGGSINVATSGQEKIEPQLPLLATVS